MAIDQVSPQMDTVHYIEHKNFLNAWTLVRAEVSQEGTN